MPCIFCLAVLALLAGAVTASWLENESVCVWDLTAAVDDASTAVTVTVYKDEKRVRIQVHSHDLTSEQVKRLEDELAAVLDAEITERAEEGLDDVHEEEDEEKEAQAEADRLREERGRPRS